MFLIIFLVVFTEVLLTATGIAPARSASLKISSVIFPSLSTDLMTFLVSVGLCSEDVKYFINLSVSNPISSSSQSPKVFSVTFPSLSIILMVRVEVTEVLEVSGMEDIN